MIGKYLQDEVYDPHEIKGSFLSNRLLYTPIPKKYIFKKITLDNYDGLIYPWEHVQNMYRNLELVIQDSDAKCKTFLTTFRGSTWAWYNNLKPNSIMGFNDLCAKLISWFSTSILAKRSFMKLFSVTHSRRNPPGHIWRGSTKKYWS
jgi:hypothetical protein